MIFGLTTPALQDVEHIWRYTQRNWGAAQADVYIDGLMLRLQEATQTPSLWRDRAEIVDGLISLSYEHHHCFCRIASDQLVVIRVLHERMDFTSHLVDG